MSDALRDLVKRSVHLSMISINESDLEDLIRELSALMNLIKKLDEIDLRDVEPLFYAWENAEVLREDEVSEKNESIFEWLERNTSVENRLVKGPRSVEEK